ncbi:MAG TPA: hypothetical protein PKA37_16755 [Planctomycetota bacterium]|nr:hypothetical protein [Planctomycetota bacterium]
MFRMTLLLLLVALSLPCMAQAPCSAVPLQLGMNYGDTSTSIWVGQGTSDPYYLGNNPLVPCAGYGTNLSKEVWYRFTAPSNGTLFIDACSGFSGTPAFANFDLDLAAWSGTSCGTLVAPVCNANYTILSECANAPYGYSGVLIMSALAGSTYYIRVNGSQASDEGAYGLAVFFQTLTPFTLDLVGTSGNLLVDIYNGTPNRPYFTAASFEAANFSQQHVGLGWWYGLHINIPELILQAGINQPPFRGFLDPGGSATISLPYPPTLNGLKFAAVTVLLHPSSGAPEIASNVATYTFF